MNDTAYWSYSTAQLYAAFKTRPEGLRDADVRTQQQRYGPNELVEKKKQSVIVQFLKKFLNPLVMILLGASLLSASLGQVTNFIIIAAIILLSVIIDTYQEHHAQEAAQKLRQKVSLKATVMRNDTKQEIPVHDLVPGDVILLSVGDIIPADARLISSHSLLVDQAILTGESFPQDKNETALPTTSVALAERTNSVFMGTVVLSGEATAVVVATGAATELGRVSKQIAAVRPATDFERGIRQFGFLLMKTVLILVAFVFIVNTFIKHTNYLESFLFALALAVGLTPELLPVIVTINLSRGALRMAKKHVIVKDLPGIQNLGSMSVLCTDKTGTLTEGSVKLERYEDIKGQESAEVLRYGFLNSYFQTGLKSPLEHAVLAHTEVSVADYKKIDEIPFDFTRKRLSVVVQHGAERLLISSGAPEAIEPLCTLSKDQRATIHRRFAMLSGQGFRVLAVAYKPVAHETPYEPDDESSLTFVGLMAFLDPPKPSASDALRRLEEQGVAIKILTGDNELVTQKICADLHVPVAGTVVGSALEGINEAEFNRLVRTTTIFARLTPEQKTNIIMSLKKQGFVVGFLGDGVNDAPSLRAADVGISVDTAVDVAKESADFILLRQDLHVLRDGVSEGRKTYGNIMKYIMMGTSSNVGNMISVAGASLFLPFLPMLPIQILLNNLLYDISELFVPGDHVDTDYIQQPRKWDVTFIRKFMLVFGPLSSLFDFVTFAALLLLLKASVARFQTGWFVESLVTQTLIVFSIRTHHVPFFMSKPSRWLLLGSLGIVVFGLLLPFTPVASYFMLVPLHLGFFGLLVAIVVSYVILVDVVKYWFYKKHALK